MSFTESNYESAILQLFQQRLGYAYLYGPHIPRDYHSPLYEDVLLPALQRVNPGLPLDALNEAVYKLKNFESSEERSTLVNLVAIWLCAAANRLDSSYLSN